MTEATLPLTLLQLAGAAPKTPSWARSVLVLVDAQNEYVDGKLPLAGIDAAVAEARRLLDAARETGTPVIHIVQHSPAGRPLFEAGSHAAEIIPALAPLSGETVIPKTLPNAFAGTTLAETLKDIAAREGRPEIILAGFMTHMCISATARASLDLGIATTVVAAATATRDIPDPLGGIIPAETVHRTALAALADRFAAVVRDISAVAKA
jgi:nicotinamidase-related amidase